MEAGGTAIQPTQQWSPGKSTPSSSCHGHYDGSATQSHAYMCIVCRMAGIYGKRWVIGGGKSKQMEWPRTARYTPEQRPLSTGTSNSATLFRFPSIDGEFQLGKGKKRKHCDLQCESPQWATETPGGTDVSDSNKHQRKASNSPVSNNLRMPLSRGRCIYGWYSGPHEIMISTSQTFHHFFFANWNHPNFTNKFNTLIYKGISLVLL